MKKLLLTGMVVLVMFGICSSSFGDYFLIYNVSTTMKGIDFDIDSQVSAPVKGYLLVKLDDSDAILDANLILYGNDANTPKKVKVYAQLNSSDSSTNNYLDWDTDKSVGLKGTYVFTNVWTYGNILSPFDFEWLIMGKQVVKNVGTLAGNRPVVSSAKGVLMVWSGMLLDYDQDLEGTSNISLTLNMSYTKAVNDSEPTWTQDQIVNGQTINGKERGIIPDLEAKHYVATDMP